MKKLNRRDLCYAVGNRAAMLSSRQRAFAWTELTRQLELLGHPDNVRTPRFADLLKAIRTAIRTATINSHKKD